LQLKAKEPHTRLDTKSEMAARIVDVYFRTLYFTNT
jgi:hypothetical protein